MTTICPCGTAFEQPSKHRGRSYTYCATCRPRGVDKTGKPRSGLRNDGDDDPLLRLPDMIASREAAGHPVIVEHEAGTLEPHTQRLYATLGVLVRFRPADK